VVVVVVMLVEVVEVVVVMVEMVEVVVVMVVVMVVMVVLLLVMVGAAAAYMRIYFTVLFTSHMLKSLVVTSSFMSIHFACSQ